MVNQEVFASEEPKIPFWKKETGKIGAVARQLATNQKYVINPEMVANKANLNPMRLQIGGVLDVSLPELSERPRLFAPTMYISPDILRSLEFVQIGIQRQIRKGKYSPLVGGIALAVEPLIASPTFALGPEPDSENIRAYIENNVTIAEIMDASEPNNFRHSIKALGWLRFQDQLLLHGIKNGNYFELLADTVENITKQQIQYNGFFPPIQKKPTFISQDRTGPSLLDLMGAVSFDTAFLDGIHSAPRYRIDLDQILRFVCSYQAMRRLRP